MHVVIETINVGPIKAVIVVAADEYLVRYGKSQNQFMKSIASASFPFITKPSVSSTVKAT